MKFGKTDDQTAAEVDRALDKRVRSFFPRRVFAWHPVPIEDGRWAWLEHVWRTGSPGFWECDFDSWHYFSTLQAASKEASTLFEDYDHISWFVREYRRIFANT